MATSRLARRSRFVFSAHARWNYLQEQQEDHVGKKHKSHLPKKLEQRLRKAFPGHMTPTQDQERQVYKALLIILGRAGDIRVPKKAFDEIMLHNGAGGVLLMDIEDDEVVLRILERSAARLRNS